MKNLPIDQKSSYRRGTVMGLTAAEAFMLISFILLLLLGLWRQNANEEISQMERFVSNLSPEQRDIAILYKDELSKLNDLLEEVREYQEAIDASDSPEEIIDAMNLYDSLRNYDPHDIERRAHLLDRQLVERLAEAAALMPDEQLRTLTDLAQLEEIPSVDEFRDAKSEASGLREELGEYTETGMTPDEVARIGELRRHAGRTGAEVAAAIRNQAGTTIERLGGEILDNGNVIFPDSLLFDAGSAAIKPEFDRVLGNFCRPWFEILYDVDKSLSRVQIEGHASSDWNNAPPDIAFEKNLDLSQRRAGAVFKRCLSFGGEDEVARWARSKLAAIGFSSSRPILNNGVEDRERSRRVVFAIDTRSVQDVVSDESGASISKGSEVKSDQNNQQELSGQKIPDESWYSSHGYKKLSGEINHVRDGDTIVLEGKAVRLEGVHAPELRDEGGQRAKDLMESISLNNNATCWLSGERTYDRLVGVCFVQGEDIGGKIISNGLGRDCPAFSGGRYAHIEQDVAKNGLDLPQYCG
ncbi:OmpA family protein [Onishia taeanensis]